MNKANGNQAYNPGKLEKKSSLSHERYMKGSSGFNFTHNQTRRTRNKQFVASDDNTSARNHNQYSIKINPSGNIQVGLPRVPQRKSAANAADADSGEYSPRLNQVASEGVTRREPVIGSHHVLASPNDSLHDIAKGAGGALKMPSLVDSRNTNAATLSLGSSTVNQGLPDASDGSDLTLPGLARHQQLRYVNRTELKQSSYGSGCKSIILHVFLITFL